MTCSKLYTFIMYNLIVLTSVYIHEIIPTITPKMSHAIWFTVSLHPTWLLLKTTVPSPAPLYRQAAPSLLSATGDAFGLSTRVCEWNQNIYSIGPVCFHFAGCFDICVLSPISLLCPFLFQGNITLYG